VAEVDVLPREGVEAALALARVHGQGVQHATPEGDDHLVLVVPAAEEREQLRAVRGVATTAHARSFDAMVLPPFIRGSAPFGFGGPISGPGGLPDDWGPWGRRGSSSAFWEAIETV
jgi:hypothetical protein